MKDNPTFSLIMATLGRDKEIVAFCKSLASQSYKNYDLIIVDQNDDDRVIPIVEEFKTQFPITHIRSSQKGLSHNRNIGLQYAHGDIIAFPDDDCEYKNDTLKNVLDYLHQYDFVSFSLTNDVEDRFKFYNKTHSFEINPKTFYYAGPSYVLFINKDALSNFKFDEKLGCGTEFGAGEESDMVLFMLSKNKKGFFSCENRIYHPYKDPSKYKQRAYLYALGYGALYKKAVFVYHFHSLFLQFLKMLLKNILAIIVIPDKTYRLKIFWKKIEGFIQYKREII